MDHHNSQHCDYQAAGEQVAGDLVTLAEHGIDISEAVYRRFLNDCPEAQAHLDTVDRRMRGRMLEQIIRLLSGDVEDGYLEFETRMHQSYGAGLAMYRRILEAVKREVCAQLQQIDLELWRDSSERQWNDRIGGILSEIEHHDGAKVR